MSYPRYVTPGSYWLITRRCVDGQFLLRPDAKTNSAICSCLGLAAQATGVEIVGFQVMSNHYHAVVRDPGCRLSEFLERFHGLVARVMNSILRRQGIFWAPEPTCATRLVKPKDVLRKILYTLLNPVVARLVDRVGDWPGASAYPAMLSGKSIVVQQPIEYFKKREGAFKEVTVTLVRPPGFETFAAEQWAEFLRKQVKRREDRARGFRVRNGLALLGRKAVFAVSPSDKPRNPLPRGKLRPDVACKDRAARIRTLRKLKEFKVAHEAARKELQANVLDIVFPYGAYRMRIMGHPCEGLS